MELHELVRFGSDGSLPTTLDLADCAGANEHLDVVAWLQATPVRQDALATWQGHPVLARLLTGPDSGLWLEREKEGRRQLAALNLPHLSLLKEARTPLSGAWQLYDATEDLQNVEVAWRPLLDEPPLTEAQQALLGEVLAMLGALHRQGLWPADPSLRHFIRSSGQIYLLDAGTLCRETPGTALSRGKVLVNLGRFFAQLPARFEPVFEELLVFYLLANGEHALPLEALLKEVNKARTLRLSEQLARLASSSPICNVKRNANELRGVLRSVEEPLGNILADPEAAWQQGTPVVAGNGASVRLETPVGPVQLRRYPAPSGWQRLRPSAAWDAWLEGHRRYLCGYRFKRPLAVLERRLFGLRGVSYLVSED